MSKTLFHRRIRLTAALALVLVAGAVAASPASAAPPIGTHYCMDGRVTFSTWDAASQHVADKVVNQYAGLFTAGENDPANVSRDALRQFYDAIETSDATGNYGVDTTIANYVIHRISLGDCPFSDNHVFLCYSKSSDVPGVWPVGQAQDLIDGGYWAPAAMAGIVDGGTNIGNFHLVCNPPVSDGKLALAPDPLDPPADLYIGGSGEMVGSAADGVPGYYRYIS